MLAGPYSKLQRRSTKEWALDGVHTAKENFRFTRPRWPLADKTIDAREATQRIVGGEPVNIERNVKVYFQDRVRLSRDTKAECKSLKDVENFVERFDSDEGPSEIYQVDSGQKSGWVHPSKHELANYFDGDADFQINYDELVKGGTPSKLKSKPDTVADYQFHRLVKQIPKQVNEYLDFSAYEQSMRELVNSNPGHVDMISLGTTEQGRDIWALKVGQGKKQAVVTGLTHAREWLTGQVALETAARMAANPELCEQTTAWIIPVHNPDGYEMSRNEDCSVRTNANQVDINRNNIAEWRLAGDKPGVTYDDKGASDKVGSSLYRGEAPASEMETKALNRFFEQRPGVDHWLDLHGYGELIILHEPEDIEAQSGLIQELSRELPGFKTMSLSEYGEVTGTGLQFAKQNGITAAVLELGTSFQPSGKEREQAFEQGVAASLSFLQD